jgi:hypothetical protein
VIAESLRNALSTVQRRFDDAAFIFNPGIQVELERKILKSRSLVIAGMAR